MSSNYIVTWSIPFFLYRTTFRSNWYSHFYIHILFEDFVELCLIHGVLLILINILAQMSSVVFLAILFFRIG